MTRTRVDGILMLYHHWLAPNAPTIMEHVGAFERYSRFKVWAVNTEMGYPGALDSLDFRIVVLHYSIFGWLPFCISDRFLRYLEASRASFKVAFFQDECRYWPQRAEFINRSQINCVYTLVEPKYFGATYQKYTRSPKLVYTLPGYVGDELVFLASHLSKPSADRTIDIGYRGRQLPYLYGRGAMEKHWIGIRFRDLAGGLGLKLDIESEERKRIYGEKYYAFLANCRAVLGVEAGVSIFDIDDVVRPQYEKLLAENPRISFEEAYAQLLHRYEDNIPYRTISPRHFEAAALRVCQILFEGKYSGVMEPMVHYISLKKDFSNFAEVVRLFKDERLRQEIVDNAYRDLIASGRYSYRRFVESFDQELLSAGFAPGITPSQSDEVTNLLDRGSTYRLLRARATSLRYRQFPGRRFVKLFARPLLEKVKTMRQERS
jgi:hypothetical protein